MSKAQNQPKKVIRLCLRMYYITYLHKIYTFKSGSLKRQLFIQQLLLEGITYVGLMMVGLGEIKTTIKRIRLVLKCGT